MLLMLYTSPLKKLLWRDAEIQIRIAICTFHVNHDSSAIAEMNSFLSIFFLFNCYGQLLN